MIEISLYFALGFLIATLLALLLMPAVWRRAVRLTRRQMEATTPLTRAEILADRDQIAAEYAVAIRRYEMGVGALRRRVADHMTTVTRQGDQIRALSAERDTIKAEVDRLTERLAAHTARDKNLDTTLDKMEALEAENRRLASERAKAVAELQRLEARASAISRDKDATTDELQSLLHRLEEAEARAGARAETIQRQLDQRTAELADAERVAAEAKAARVEAAARLASGATEIASLRAEREALTLKLAAFQTGRSLASDGAPGDNVVTTIDDLERQRLDLDHRLAEATAERDGLRARLAELEVRLATPPSQTDAEFATLRRALTDLGERFVLADASATPPVATLPPPIPPAAFAAPTERNAPADEADGADAGARDDSAATLPPATFPFAPPGGPFTPAATPEDGDGDDEGRHARRGAKADAR